jgi:hypothetical protein
LRKRNSTRERVAVLDHLIDEADAERLLGVDRAPGLSSNEYLMGSEYSVADAHLFVVSNWVSWVNFDLSLIAQYSLTARIRAHPAVAAALVIEGLVPWQPLRACTNRGNRLWIQGRPPESGQGLRTPEKC